MPLDYGRRRVILALAALPIGAAAASRVGSDDLMEEVDYRVLDPAQPVTAKARVEVIEFFYYGCRWCNEFQPYLDEWLLRKPADVAFRYQPAIRNTRWIVLTKAFYALQALGQLPRLHVPLYRAYHREGINVEDQAVLTGWALKHGIDFKAFDALMRSDEIMSKVAASRELTYAYQVDSTPSVVVNGRYLTNSGIAGGVPRLMEVMEGLIALARKEAR
ncbi:MAG TPA: thiol:disulfide interchange protein DsbA/DsbL [Burkholderiales bacterium]|nr:thiol:disulfide interchange protein DsbA/DsbL [Burkholderiales bacterium]